MKGTLVGGWLFTFLTYEVVEQRATKLLSRRSYFQFIAMYVSLI